MTAQGARGGATACWDRTSYASPRGPHCTEMEDSFPKKDFPRKHDTIFRYTKGDNYFFAPIYRPYSEGTVQRGRTAVKGKYFEEGLRAEGTPVNDWWTDVPKITSPNDKEKRVS